MLPLISLIFMIVVLDGIVSAAEAAIFTVPPARAKFLSETSRAGRSLFALKEAMGGPISVLVALSNLITIAGSVFSGILAVQVFGEQWVGVFAACLTFLIMVFAEIMPKRFGERHAEQVALLIALPLEFIVKMFTPILRAIEKVSGPITPYKKVSTSEEEIAFLAKLGVREGAIEDYEGEMIQRVFKLNNITAADMMTPRPLVFFLDGNRTLGESQDLIHQTKYSRIPVYDKKPDRVLGIVHIKELLAAMLQNKNGMLLREFVKSPLVVPEDKLGDELLREFQKTKQNLAVVVDDHGRVVGVVGVEDILEELVGEILEEKEISPELIKRVSKNEIVVHGETQVSTLNRFFNINIPDHRTLNGYLLKRFGRLPVAHEIIEVDNLKFIVEEVSPSAIERVRVVRVE
jgi:CBS domain containing-hemolysin-like protein